MKQHSGGSGKLPFFTALAWLLGAALALSCLSSSAQQLTGTISGTAYDQSGAVVPNCKVVLKNQDSGDVRNTTTGSDGHFVITAVQPGTYSIEISAKGFSSWQENDIAMNQGDSRDVPGIKLNVGGNSTQVNVVAGADAVVPTDTAEISTTINQQMINDFPLAGRDAGELLKILPGMALNNGGSQGSGFNAKVVGTNNGPVGAYSSNGTQPYGTMAFLLDGANLVDPGNDGTQIANINPDMVSQVKVLVSNYGAEYAKGPVIFSAFSRSGGSQFHGEGYLYTHNATLNSVDAFSKAIDPKVGNAGESYYYMGGNVGGPLILPKFMHFNQNHNKLFFWGGYEYMKQSPAGSVKLYNVPNTEQLNGDFSSADYSQTVKNLYPTFYSQLKPNVTNAAMGVTTTTLPASAIDPNFKNILALYPKTNISQAAVNSGSPNYEYIQQTPQNRWEATGKVDYAISDNDKVTGSYTFQQENDLAPISIWWAEPQTLPYPSAAASKTQVYVILTNYTHVFSPTTTNEFVFTWSHFKNPYALTDPDKVNRHDLGFGANGLFGHTTDQIPNFEPGYCCSGDLASFNFYPMSSGSSTKSGTFGGIKQVPAFYDNFTKIVGNHTLKVGFYWDTQANTQNSNAADNGTYAFESWNPNSTGNVLADELLGNIQSYAQQNLNVTQAIKWHQWSIYGEDSFKASKSLTINVGLRADHIGQWYGTDFDVWNPSTYVNSTNASAYPNTGVSWHANDPSVPVSGFPSRLFFYAPRLGFAYDIFGNGRTVFRGGLGTYYYQASTEVGSAATLPQGSFQFTTPNWYNGYATINNPVTDPVNNPSGPSNFTPPNSVAANGTSIYAMQMGDSRVPFTTNWNATISQALPWRSVLEFSYIGNRSANEYEDGTNSKLFDLNNVAPGAFFQADPVLGYAVSPNAPTCTAGKVGVAGDYTGCGGANSMTRTQYAATFSKYDYYPLKAYQEIYLLTHAPYSKYNGFQASFQKQSGPVTFITNYTFSKVLGIRDGGSNNGNGNGTGVDPFVLKNNYGPLAYDHTQILNFSYNWATPSLIHGNSLLSNLAAGAVNGWKLSGYTAWQSGSPLQPSTGGNLNASYTPDNLTYPTNANPDLPDLTITLPNGLRAAQVNPSTWFGTSSYNVLIPALTCDPRKGLHLSGQRFNPACFTIPAQGQQGPNVLPYIRNPNYFDTDLGIYKSFRVTESQRVEIRASATNWLNHPLRQFDLENTNDESLHFYNPGPNSTVSLSPTNTNTTTTGVPAFKTGSRFVTLAAKYYF
jgi:hypothetical protein